MHMVIVHCVRGIARKAKTRAHAPSAHTVTPRPSGTRFRGRVVWRLERGDVALTNNHRIPHGHAAFVDGPRPRHHVRLWLRLRPRQSPSPPEQRGPCAPL